MKLFKKSKRISFLITLFFVLQSMPLSLLGQGNTKWMAVGSVHNWYSEFGAEIEHGLQASQQFGLRWPAEHSFMDMQAAKACWIGVENFTDAAQYGSSNFQHKVVHVGPRVTGADEWHPVEFKTISKFAPPEVYVDGNLTYQLANDVEEIDPNLPYDKMIYNEINTMIGATVLRKIYQFSQEYHDNYIVHETTITNTGNVDGDDEIELNATLENLYIYYMARYAVSRNTRYVMGNATGWGINTMIDVRGDGLGNQYGTEDEDIRANYAWHGKFPGFTAYDNIGAPIWTPTTSGGLLTLADTVGRLGSPQFVGTVTLQADTGPNDKTDDVLQPSTTSYEGSDMDYTSNNDPFNPVKMDKEYKIMTKGHAPRHAYVVEPEGKFTTPTGDPKLTSSGGYSNAYGYGPYNLAPGESITIVWAEAASGLSWDNSIEIGKQFKRGVISATTKNEHVMSGKDSLFQTFRRAIANYNQGNGFTIPQNPYPPSVFDIAGLGDRIALTWKYDESVGPAISGFEIYRAREEVDSTYYKIYTAGPTERIFNDSTAVRGISYFYYIQAIGLVSDNTGGGLTPSGVALKSGKFYTKAYEPTQLKRKAEDHVSKFRVVPNPYIRSSEINFGSSEANKIAFYGITGDCKIQIFTEMGELIKEFDHKDGSGDEFWFQTTNSNQLVVSGVYIAVVTDNLTGEKSIQKFSIIQ